MNEEDLQNEISRLKILIWRYVNARTDEDHAIAWWFLVQEANGYKDNEQTN